MKIVIGFIGSLLIWGGVVLGLYLVIGYMFIGGILQIVNASSTGDIAVGILKIIFCELGMIPAYILIVLGVAISE